MKSRHLFSLSLALFAIDAAAAVFPGRLDPGFGVAGKQVVPIDMDASDTVNAVTSLVGPDGNLYIIGTALDGNNSAMAIARLDTNGAIDTGFGEDGAAVFLPDGVSDAQVHDATFDGEGRLVVVGEALVAGSTSIIACRLDADGALDSTFGRPLTPGCYTAALQGGVAHAVVVQHGTGRLIMAGSLLSMAKRTGIVLALTPDGATSDSSFGAGFGLQFISDEKPTEFLDLAQNAAGQLVAAGTIVLAEDNQDFLAYRLDADGQPVLSFNDIAARSSAIDLSNDYRVDEATVASLFDDGTVLLGGIAQKDALGYRPAVARILSDGADDPTFHYDGSLAPYAEGRIAYDLCGDICDMRAHDMEVLPNGNIILTGSISVGVQGDNAATLSTRSDFFALRLLPNGKPDPSFRSPGSAFDGLSIIPFDRLGTPSQDAAFSLALQGDTLLVAGFARTDDNPGDTIPDFGAAIARLGNGAQLFGDGFE